MSDYTTTDEAEVQAPVSAQELWEYDNYEFLLAEANEQPSHEE